MLRGDIVYSLPNNIFICPWEIDDFEDVIRHEITHLKYEDKVKNMTHEEKEAYIDSKM